MFLKKLFNFGKDYKHYQEKGDRFLADERFADARNAYNDALEKIAAGGEPLPEQVEAIRRKIALTGDGLARMNLVEAEHALSGGDEEKAGEHLRIAMDLAEDAAIRGEAERLLAGLGSEAPETALPEAVPACDSCAEEVAEAESSEQHAGDDSITGEDKLSLYFHTLPGDLPERYAGMGEEFARGCLLNLEGNGEEALRVFGELSATTDNDILNYEMAIIHYHKGDAGRCEQLLMEAIDLNPANPLCHIGLVQLFIEAGREREALGVVERMIANDLVPEQARLMQGDLYTLLRDEAKAVESYTWVLNSPRYAREAAERLVPVLVRQGRTEEATHLAKKFAKGCR